jgi:hypothetical protein
MNRHRLKRPLERIWLAASIILVLLGLRSIVHARYQVPWDSWRELPWSRKLQPFELAVERYFKNSDTAGTGVSVPDESSIREAIQSGANWLVSVQEPSGHFKYWYAPDTDEFSPASEDSFHRQACAAYGLVLAFEITGNPQYQKAARKSLDYLLSFKRTLPPDMSYFFAEDQADLGGSALPLIVMLRLREATGTADYDPELKRLTRFLLFLQEQYGTGEFKSTYVYRGKYGIEKDLGWESPISPGQAMLALAWMYREFQDPVYRDSIDRALKFYSNSKYWKHPAFPPWTISAFASMYATTHEPAYSDYAAKLTDYVLTLQNMDETNDVYGSFGNFPSIASASYLEALGDAVKMTEDNGDSQRKALYTRRAQSGYRWLLTLQYSKGNVAGLRASERALGGFAFSRYERQIRIDYNFHAISALVGDLQNVHGWNLHSPTVPQ